MRQIRGANRPTPVKFLPFPCFRLLPTSPGSFRFGSHLVFVVDGNMSGDHDDDVGGAYLETQQVMSQICGENRPNLMLFLPFFAFVSFRLLLSASAIFRRRPFRVASGPCG